MDLNIIIDNCGSRNPNDVIQAKINRCKDLGFETIALSVVVDQVENINDPPDLKEFTIPRYFEVLTRLHLKISDNSELFKLSKSKKRSKYDLLALEPQNEKVLQYISSGNAKLEILTFDFCKKLDISFFKFKFTDIVRKGVCLEINYGPAQINSAIRRNVICQGQSLTEKCSSSIILSSGLDDIFRFRGPIDAKNIGTIFLLSTNKSHDAVYKNGAKAINLGKSNLNPVASAIAPVEEV